MLTPIQAWLLTFSNFQNYRQIFNYTYTTRIPMEFEYAWFTHILACLFSPEFNLRILPLPMPYVYQAESQRLPLMKQISLTSILEIQAFSAWCFIKILEIQVLPAWWFP